MRMRDKVAIVTGAASGIGRGIALAFAREGAKVAIADLNLEGAEAVAGEIRDIGGQAIGVAMDVTDEAQVEAGVERAASELGGVHVLVSNAGVQMIGALHELPFSTWKKMLAIHLDGAFLTTSACLKRMYAQNEGGSIVYMGSVHSKIASPLKAPYVTAKHGLLGLCRVVAKEGAAHPSHALTGQSLIVSHGWCME